MDNSPRQKFFHAIDEIIEILASTRGLVLYQEGSEADIRQAFRQIAGKLDLLRRYPEELEAAKQQILSLIQPLLTPDEKVLLSRYEALNLDEKRKIEKAVTKKVNAAASSSSDKSLELIREISNNLGCRIHNDSVPQAIEELYGHVSSHLQHDGAMHSAIQQFLLGIEDQINELNQKIPRKKALKSPAFIREALQGNSIPREPEQVRALLSKAEEAIRESVEELDEFTRTVQSSLEKQAVTMAKLNAKLQAAQTEARSDALTSLANRRSLSEFLDKLGSQPALLMVLDIDHFKKINDTYGHHAGDEALVHVAKIFKESTRKSDLVARYGGEEFCIIMEPLPQEDAENLANTIRSAVAIRPVSCGNQPINLTISIGVALRWPSEPIKKWLERADTALYQAKVRGRNRVEVSQPYERSTNE